MTDRMPRTERLGTDHPTDVGFLAFTYRNWLAGKPNYLSSVSSVSPAPRTVLGLGLPGWQREFKWTQQQCERFIESIWKGVSIGSWMINVVDQGGLHSLDGLVIDGQQRLTALQRYLDNELSTPAADGTRLFWSDLDLIEQRRFLRAPFPHIEVRLTDESKLRELYDLLNYGGTPHLESERASVPRRDGDGGGNVQASGWDELGFQNPSAADELYFDVDAPRA